MRTSLALWCLLLAAAVDAGPKMVCYYPNWAYYRAGTAKFTTDNVDVSLCTHVVYAFATLDATTYTIKPYDSWLDINLGNYAKAVAIKQRNPNVKILIAIGGWNDSQGNKYSAMVSSSTSIATFTNSVMSFLQMYGFDGLDLDWEFPTAADKTNFANLVKALRTKFGTTYELTMAASASPAVLDSSYDVPTLSANLDAIHLMTYDMHGPWESNADSHAPLYKRPWEADGNNVDYTVNYWIRKGASPSKLILGIPTYGKTWKINSLSSVAPPKAYASGAGAAGSGTQEPGLLAYWEICSNIKAGGWTVIQDPNGNAGPYAYSSSTMTWVGYDDVAIASKKGSYARSKNLGGAMIWDAAMDDFNNVCGSGKNPLITAIVNALNSGSSSGTTTTSSPVTTTKSAVSTSITTKASVVTTATTKPSVVTTKLPGSFVCPGNGLYACPTDCSKFYNCLNGVAILQSCSIGTLFNSVSKVCDWPANVVCP